MFTFCSYKYYYNNNIYYILKELRAKNVKIYYNCNSEHHYNIYNFYSSDIIYNNIFTKNKNIRDKNKLIKFIYMYFKKIVIISIGIWLAMAE